MQHARGGQEISGHHMKLLRQEDGANSELRHWLTVKPLDVRYLN